MHRLVVILLIPVCILWAFIEPVLLALGQPEILSSDVQRFLRVLIIGAPGYIGFESLKKYLQCQGKYIFFIETRVFSPCHKGIMGASTAVLAVVFPINIGLNVLFVHFTSLGLLGSPVALSLTYWMAFALLSVYTAWSPHASPEWLLGRVAIACGVPPAQLLSFPQVGYSRNPHGWD